jgi:hypothetical protein
LFPKPTDSSTLMAKKNVVEFDVQTILDDFAVLPDPRSHINQLHLLGDTVVISIIAVIAGAEGPLAIGVWAKSVGLKSGSNFAVAYLRTIPLEES